MVDDTPVLAMAFMKSHQNLKRAKNAYKEAWDEYQSAHNCLFMLDLYTGRDNVADWDRLLPSNAASNEDKWSYFLRSHLVVFIIDQVWIQASFIFMIYANYYNIG